MSRPQVSIERLPARRASAAETRESMNCKSCRKRKIKCNRTRPSCEACSVFQCPCVYDAIPKKRGPKTDVLEALLKRVDGLERKFQDENPPSSASENPTSPDKSAENNEPETTKSEEQTLTLDTNLPSAVPATTHPVTLSVGAETPFHESFTNGPFSSISSYPVSAQPVLLPDSALDTFFTRINGRPFHILDEAGTRQRYQMGQLPSSLSIAIYAVTLRYNSASFDSEIALRQAVADAAHKARQQVDPDEPSIEGIQTLLLLSLALSANGQGKKAYMALANCIGMSNALDMCREVPSKAKLLSTERETRRRLFWTCYILDRFNTCGSKRPCFLSDHSISLRLPSWSSPGSGLRVEGELFNVGPNIHYSPGPRRKGQDATALLIDIARILGVTNQYLAAGGVKGDSHFPWHSLSNLSKIRQELDIWAAGTQDMFASIETLFNHPDCTTLLLSKLIYHLVHCLIYRPFLPIDLVELRGSGQHQSWQIEATNLCFAHANAIAELVELGKSTPLVEWPGFVSYTISTAATVHVHGAHYRGTEGDVFSSSPNLLSREMHQLSWLRKLWAGVQHQQDMLHNVFNAHAELVRTLASNPLRFSPVFHLEDFFDRYPGCSFDDAHVKLTDFPITESPESSNFASNPTSAFPTQSTGMVHSSYQQPPQNRQQQSTVRYQSMAPPSPRTTKVTPPKSNANVHSDPTPTSSTVNFSLPPHTVSQQPSHVSSSSSQTVQGTPSFATDSHVQDLFAGSSFSFSPFAPHADPMFDLVSATPPSGLQYATFPFDPQSHGGAGSSATAHTPGAQSQGSHGTGPSETGSGEKDPFLMLLEQLTENEQNNPLGGQSELDFFLAGGTVPGAGDGEGAEMRVGSVENGTDGGGDRRMGGDGVDAVGAETSTARFKS